MFSVLDVKFLDQNLLSHRVSLKTESKPASLVSNIFATYSKLRL